MTAKWPKDPSVGNIEADVFDPATWKTEYPNPSFNQMDAADAFWAASIISRFTDEMIARIVADARLSNPAAAGLSDRRHHQAARQDRAMGHHRHQSRRSIRGPQRARRRSSRSTTPRSASNSSSRPRHTPCAGRRSTTARVWRSRCSPKSRPLEPASPFRRVSGVRRMTPAFATPSASISTSHPSFTHWASPVVVTIRNRKGMLDVVGIDRQTDRSRVDERQP